MNDCEIREISLGIERLVREGRGTIFVGQDGMICRYELRRFAKRHSFAAGNLRVDVKYIPLQDIDCAPHATGGVMLRLPQEAERDAYYEDFTFSRRLGRWDFEYNKRGKVPLSILRTHPTSYDRLNNLRRNLRI